MLDLFQRPEDTWDYTLKKLLLYTALGAVFFFRAECRPEGRGLKLWLPGLIFRALVSSPTTDLDF